MSTKEEFTYSPLAVVVPQEAMIPIVELTGNHDGGERFDESSAWKDSPPEPQIAF